MRTFQRRLVRDAAAAGSEILLLEVLHTGGHSPRMEAVLHKLKSYTFVFVFVIAVIGLTISSARAAILTVDGTGQLTGATSVDLGSLGFFNVSFIDGSCIGLFTGCDTVSDFDFATMADASTAATALLDQVYIDHDPSAPASHFDLLPFMTFGYNTDFGTPCVTLIPFIVLDGGQFGLEATSNSSNELEDGITFFSAPVNFDTAAFDEFYFASFTKVSAIPLPPAVLLFVTALVGLAGIAVRQRRAKRN